MLDTERALEKVYKASLFSYLVCLLKELRQKMIENGNLKDPPPSSLIVFERLRKGTDLCSLGIRDMARLLHIALGTGNV